MSAHQGIPWEDVELAAERMFKVWAFGGELDWARECWGHFARNGLTSGGSVMETTRSHLRLLTLAKVYEEFSARMWDENPDSDLTSLSEKLEIDPVALGIIVAEDAELEAEETEDAHDLREHALKLATDQLRSEIHGCLTAACGGEGALYSRMAKTNRLADQDDDEAAESSDEFSPSGPHVRAWQFVSNCFQEP
jgi:hypothetical protein